MKRMSNPQIAEGWYEMGLLDEVREEFCAMLTMQLLTRESLQYCFKENVGMFAVAAWRLVDELTLESLTAFIRKKLQHEKNTLQEICLFTLDCRGKSDAEIAHEGIRMLRNRQWLEGDDDEEEG